MPYMDGPLTIGRFVRLAGLSAGARLIASDVATLP